MTMTAPRWMCAASALVAALPGMAKAEGKTDKPVDQAHFMRVYGPAQPPYGFLRFCEKYPEECAAQAVVEDVRFDATPERMTELDEVNRWANAKFIGATDQEIYNVSENWEYPVDRGDCEDYALIKERMLKMRGWPKSSLLLTVVRDKKGEGHAVLTVRTKLGDFVLDNQVDDIKPWNETGYYFLARQSYLDPQAWVSVDPTYNAPEPLAVAR